MDLKLVEKTNYQLVRDDGEVSDLVKEFARHPALAVDVEGTSLDPYSSQLLLVQVATPSRAYIFPVQSLNVSALKEVLENPQILKIIQNANFDYQMLKANFGVEVNNIFDTMLAERILTMGMMRENSLDALSAKYLDIALEKNVWETFVNQTQGFTKKQLEYAALDVLVLFPIHEKQKVSLEKGGLERVAELEFSLVPAVSEMELKGFKIDVEKWHQNIRELEAKRDEVAKKIQGELRPYFRHTQVDLFGNHGDVVNLNSPMQIMEAFRKVGLDLPSTGEEVLVRYDHPLAKLLLEYRGYEKLISAFGENLIVKINPKTGRIHPDYMQIGADTGRFACSNPNLQQIPTDSAFRSCFIAENGYKLVVADYSQIELRVMAELSGDSAFMKAFNEDQDLHALTASQMFGIPLEAVDKKRRFQAKSINFGLMYGRGAKSLAAQLEVDEDQARRLLDRYFAKYSKVKAWLDKVGREAVKRKYSMTILGRKRFYSELNPGDPGFERQVSYVERQGKNHPIQGTSADMIKYALVFIFQRMKKEGLDATPIHTVHDEIVVEVKKEQAEKAKTIVEEEMVKAGQLLLKKVPVKVDVMISDRWEH